METLTQTQEAPTSVVGTVMEKLKAASQETLDQILTFLQGNSHAAAVVEEPIVEATEEIVVDDIELATEMEAPALEETSNDVELVASNGEVENVETLEETEAPTEPTTEELQNEISEETTEELQNQISEETSENAAIDVLLEAPKADIEIRLDEIYSIRVVANEVVSSIEELQNEVQALKAQVATMASPEELESKVKEMVAGALRERFV